MFSAAKAIQSATIEWFNSEASAFPREQKQQVPRVLWAPPNPPALAFTDSMQKLIINIPRNINIGINNWWMIHSCGVALYFDMDYKTLGRRMGPLTFIPATSIYMWWGAISVAELWAEPWSRTSAPPTCWVISFAPSTPTRMLVDHFILQKKITHMTKEFALDNKTKTKGCEYWSKILKGGYIQSQPWEGGLATRPLCKGLILAWCGDSCFQCFFGQPTIGLNGFWWLPNSGRYYTLIKVHM